MSDLYGPACEARPSLRHSSNAPNMPSPPPEDADTAEPSPLAYARAYGLARDHQADRSGFLELERLRDNIERDADESTALPTFDWGPEPRIEERLLMSKDAATLLQSVVRLGDINHIETLLVPLIEEKGRTHGLKLEQPVLGSDHETDCRKFASREGFDLKVQDVKLPLEVLKNTDQDNHIWSPELWNVDPALMEKIKADRLCVTKDAIAILQQCRKESWTVENEKLIWESQQLYKRNSGKDPVTPPLSPVETEILPYQPSPSDSIFQIPVSSEPLSPTKQDLQDLETEIFRQDLPEIIDATPRSSLPYSGAISGDGHILTNDIFLPFVSVDDLQRPVLVQSPRLKLKSLKVDEALTPEQPALKYPESVRFEDLADEFNLGSNSNRKSPIFESKIFEETFLPAYEEATQRAEQEVLMEADITCRVDVPIMDFSKAPAPWEVNGNFTNDPAELLSLQKQNIEITFGKNDFSWPGSTNLDHKLRWNPFPRDFSVNITEDPDLDDSTWELFLPSKTGVGIMDSSGSVWKPEGLRITKEEENELEINVGLDQAGRFLDLSSPIKMNKNEMDILFQKGGKVGVNSETLVEQTRSTFPRLIKESEKKTRKRPGEFELLSGTSFSAGNAVDSFLELRGAKKKKIDDGLNFPSSHSIISETQNLQTRVSKLPDEAIQAQLNSGSFEEQAAPPGSLICKDQRINLIVSLEMMSNRRLIKNIEDTFPCMNLVERDFSSHNKTAWLRGSVARSPVISALSSEADFIISPTTGVIITNLQKIKQKPLPGQKSQSAIRSRLVSVSARYEKLIVLVNEGGFEERTAGLDASDSLAFSEFYGFAVALDTTIMIYYVGGGKVTLAQWLATTISCFHIEGPDLLREETHWEIFLRRAGLNSFAAQAIISDLKIPIVSDRNNPIPNRSLGLARFVEMNADQRMERFGRVVGTRVMERVSALIDSRWNI
ncbi:hypothetical protein K3495_g1274 [Podosphaera aphanis]|nr:hypothetical protein K3495_g1274 [Podosphaera aphanis]